MSNFKFKPGDIVEVTKSKNGNKGHRFVVDNFAVKKLINNDGSICDVSCNSYETDIKSPGVLSKFTWSAEYNLKLVNPDIDEISDSTFSEILDEITQAITVEK